MGTEAAFEDMSGPLQPCVELLGVDAVQAVHPVREQRSPRLDDEVVVVGHQAIRVAVPAELPDRSSKEMHEEDTVKIVKEDGSLARATRGDVVDAIVQRAAWQPGHVRNVMASALETRRHDPSDTLPAHLRAMSRAWP